MTIDTLGLSNDEVFIKLLTMLANDEEIKA